MIERLRTVLPEPDSPTTPRDSPRFKRERHPVDGPDEPAIGPEVGLQVVEHEQRLVEIRARGPEVFGDASSSGRVVGGVTARTP